MENHKIDTTEHFKNYLRERDDIGKIIIHDLIGPIYNLLNLNRVIRASFSDQQNPDKPTADVAVEITERLLNKVLNLYALAFDNKRLFMLSVFDVEEVIARVIKSREVYSGVVDIASSGNNHFITGDADVVQVWLDNILSMLQERFGKSQPIVISLSEENGLSVIRIVLKGEKDKSLGNAEQFLDKALIIDKLSHLIDATVSLNEGVGFMEVLLTMRNKKEVA